MLFESIPHYQKTNLLHDVLVPASKAQSNMGVEILKPVLKCRIIIFVCGVEDIQLILNGTKHKNIVVL